MMGRRGLIGGLLAAVLAVISGVLALPAQAMTKAVHVGREGRALIGVGREVTLKAATLEELGALGKRLSPEVSALVISRDVAKAIHDARTRGVHDLDGGFYSAVAVISSAGVRIPCVVSATRRGLDVRTFRDLGEALNAACPRARR